MQSSRWLKRPETVDFRASPRIGMVLAARAITPVWCAGGHVVPRGRGRRRISPYFLQGFSRARSSRFGGVEVAATLPVGFWLLYCNGDLPPDRSPAIHFGNRRQLGSARTVGLVLFTANSLTGTRQRSHKPAGWLLEASRTMMAAGAPSEAIPSARTERGRERS
jgi:hypothetical protein